MPPLPPASNNDTSTSFQIPCEAESSLAPPTDPQQTTLLLTPTRFEPPHRIGYGTLGKQIDLRVNHFPLKLSQPTIHQYSVEILANNAPVGVRRPRAINRELLHQIILRWPDNFQGILPVFDGKTNLYTSQPLSTSKLEFKLRLHNESINREYTVTIDFCQEVTLTDLSFDATYALETILRCQGSQIHASIGKAMYSRNFIINQENLDIGHGKELWHGYHQSARKTELSTVLNIDMTSGPFHQAIPVIQYLVEVLDWHPSMLNCPERLTDAQRRRFHDRIKGLKIQTTHCAKIQKRKFKVRLVTVRCAEEQFFTMNLENGETEQWTVQEYVWKRYNLALQYPHFPCLKVGTDERPTFFPLEFCHIAYGQRCRKPMTDDETTKMINMTTRNATERERQIRKITLNTFAWAQDPYAQEFGISVETELTEVKGRILPTPRIQFANKIWVIPCQGSWDTRNRHYHTAVNIHTWALVSFANEGLLPKPAIEHFTDHLQQIAREYGMRIAEEPRFFRYATVDRVEDVLTFVKEKVPEVQIVLVVLPGKNSCYAEIKRVADKLLGLPTQCIQAPNILRPTPQLLSNICLKINMKLGGVNSILHPAIRADFQNEAIIFIGATMLTPPDRHSPSIAALVGTMDAHPSRYMAEVSVQQGRQHLILDMAEMVKKLLQNFHSVTKFKPTRIVLYREQLLESQYYNALQYELRAIRRACKSIESDYEPGITMIAVQRRHHTRLFTTVEKFGKYKNVPPGTIVDHGITHPGENDFYLCSHAGIQRTSIPSKYHVLWDDNLLSADDLQTMTHGLCYSYARCNRAVSIPAPVYYAQLAAIRARNHLASEDGHGVGSQSSGGPQNLNMNYLRNAVKVHEATGKNMYFI